MYLRRCVEYNLVESSMKTGIVIIDTPVRIELTATPTAICWNPHVGDDIEDR
jgi:hypothetical protein